MESILIFVYGILTCIVVIGIVYGVIQLKSIKENTEEAIDDVDDCKADLFTLRREYEEKVDVVYKLIEEKVDVVYKLIKDLDSKIDETYNHSVEVTEEIETKIHQNKSKIDEVEVFMENSKKDDF
jgi:uncharacterized protein YoxC